MFCESFAVAVDTVLITISNGIIKVLLIKRKNDPYKGRWALPGGFVKEREELRDAAMRELKEETGVFGANLKQFHAFGAINRDPRGRVISISYIAFLPLESKLNAASDALDASWFPVYDLPELAFDHYDIVSFAIVWIKSKIEHSAICKYLLPEYFTVKDLQFVYEAILGSSLDDNKIIRHMISSNILVEAKDFSKKLPKHYSFNSDIVA